MIKNIAKRFLSFMLTVLMVFSLFPASTLTAYAAGGTLLEGLAEGIGAEYTGSGTYSWATVGSDRINGSATGTKTQCNSSSATTTLTITNNKTNVAKLSFGYILVLNGGTITIDGTNVTANGTFEKEMAPGASISIVLTSAVAASSTTISISNLLMLVDVDATTTFQPAENGGYTVDGAEITEAMAKTQSSTIPYSLKATPAEGYKFSGWYSITDNKYLSSDVETTFNFEKNQTVTAKFVPVEAPVFQVDSARFTDLNEANQYAATNGVDKITLISDGTLPAGDYTIASGITLLIPFDEAGTCYTTTPGTVGASYTRPTAFRTLTMAEGASISVDGAISVSAKHSAESTNQFAGGSPSGPCGFVKMQSGSTITVNNGGAAYVYGFIIGDGSVTAKSGAVVYENFQIANFRGGSASFAMNGKGVFPFSQYYVQNIEVPLTLESGAEEHVYTSLYASSKPNSSSIKFIGSTGAMFIPSAGTTVTKQYLPNQDRLEISVNGDLSVSNLSLSVGGASVNSKDYVLPINNNITINVQSGTTTINQKLALLADAELNIAEGAELKIANGIDVFVYDTTEWLANNYVRDNSKLIPVKYSPTKSFTRITANMSDAKIDINGTLTVEGAIYTTESGADVISSNGTGSVNFINNPGTATKTQQVTQAGTKVTFVDILVNSIWLHNGGTNVGTETEYTTTQNAENGWVYTYNTATKTWETQNTPTTVTVTFDANGGEGTMEPQTITSRGNLAKNVFTNGDYVFGGWNTTADGTGISYADEELVNLREDTTLYAIWLHTVTWANWDGTVLKTENLKDGTMPAYTGTTPRRNQDAQYSYTFTGWTPELHPVDGNTTYTATYKETLRTYSVFWKNGTTTLETDTQVPYGTIPTYDGVEPTKAADANGEYIFTGWSPEVGPITGSTTYTAQFELKTNGYTVTWMNYDGTILETDEGVPYGTTPSYNGDLPVKAADDHCTYTFTGWTPKISEVTENITYTAEFEAQGEIHKVTFNANDGEGTMEVQFFEYGVDEQLIPNIFTRDGYKFLGWNTKADGTGTDYADKTSIRFLTEDITLYAKWQFWNGWLNDEIGTTYIVDGEQKYFKNWAIIDEKTYYFDENGYVVKGVYETMAQDNSHKAMFVFDTATGEFLRNQNGLFDVGTDIYWTEKGEVMVYAGLVRVVKDDGEICYYYFGEDNKAVKATADTKQYTVEKNNGLALPEGNKYTFDENGVIVHFDSFINGIHFDKASSEYYYCVDGVIIADGLMEIDGSYYYARTSTGAFVRNCNYWITRTHGLLEEGIYTFDEMGKIVFPEEIEKKNGIIKENGSLYYYVDGEISGAGLIQIDGDYYYVRTSTGEVVHGRTYWITVTNDLLPSGQYTFAADGKMIDPPVEPEIKNGIVAEDGSLYYYVDGVRTGAGLIQIDGDYYYVRTSNGEVIHGRKYWVTATNNLLPSGQYAFDDNGKMIIE